jgi:hypothetical protein
VDGGDNRNDETVERQVYDAGWRIVAVYRGNAADPYEQYVWHNAGMGGFGGSSYIDALVLRDRDADLDQNAVLEERLYYMPELEGRRGRGRGQHRHARRGGALQRLRRALRRPRGRHEHRPYIRLDGLDEHHRLVAAGEL